MLDKALKFIKYWTIDLLAEGIKITADELLPLFMVIAMIGVLLTMAGWRRLGTKISSLSFITYIIIKVVL
jgi:hypothetical protein